MTRTAVVRVFVAIATLTSAVTLRAQLPPAAPAVPDSEVTRARVEQLRTTARTDWAEAFEFLCSRTPTRANRPDDPLITPTRVFDNLAVVGRTGTAVWIVSTSAGLVLIDAGYEEQLADVLLAGMRTLALDPARVTHVIIGHGHSDHTGGAAYFQQRGARVAMGAADWALAPGLKRDIDVSDGQSLAVGDVTFRFAAIPGHTPGSIGVVFPVKSGRETHVAGLFGGSVLIPSFVSVEGMRAYVASLAHWQTFTRAMKVDVEIQNHPLYDGFAARLARMTPQTQGQPNPFVVGPESYQRFVEVMTGCGEVQLARRGSAP